MVKGTSKKKASSGQAIEVEDGLGDMHYDPYAVIDKPRKICKYEGRFEYMHYQLYFMANYLYVFDA